MNNEMTNLKKRNSLYIGGIIMFASGVYILVTFKNLPIVLSIINFSLAAFLLLLGYFKFQKQHDKNIPFNDEFTMKTEILAGYKAFMFCMFSFILFNPLFSFLEKFMEWDHKQKYFIASMSQMGIVILAMLLFIVLKIVYNKRGVPEKYR